MDIRKVICGLIGHSHICDIYCGWISCARCKESLADEMAQAVSPVWRKTLIFRKEGKYEGKTNWKDRIFLSKP